MTPNSPATDTSTTDPEATPFIGLPILMHMALCGDGIMQKGEELLQRARANPADANALMDLSTVMQLRGNQQMALNMQAEALKIQQLYHLPASSATPAVRLLAIMTPGELMANTPLEFLLQDSDVSLDILYVGVGVPAPETLPPHDVLFVAVAESDRNRPLLTELQGVTASWFCPVINRPEHIVRLSRDGACELLAGVPGVVMPLAVRIDRQGLAALGRGEQSIGEAEFPVVVRPVGSHAGRGLVRLDAAAAIADYLASQSGSEFYVSPFVDYGSADGLFRKYRIVFIEGRPFAVHMAVSSHWMVHYLNAEMGESEAKRAEEARFMAEFDGDFARRHAAALQAMAERVGLDYFGIDCAETPDGELLTFEVDSALVVHAMDPVDTYPYKPPQMHKLFEAFRDMLKRRAAAGQA